MLCALLIALPCVVRADDAPTQTVIRLAVTSQAAPKPALRYQLLPESREMNPGNPIQGYLVCFMEQTNFYNDKTEVENREKWLTMPLKELPLKELHDYGGVGLRQADYAARLDKPDWQILLKLRRDGVNTLLPDVQVMRRLASGLKVRFRAEVAERRFGDALVTAKTMFALSRHLGEHPTFIGDLVALAIAFMTVGPVEEMIQQPGCPNLYWALSDLPAPFIDFRQGRLGERDETDVEFVLLDEKEPMSDAQLKQALDHFRKLIAGQHLENALWADPPKPPKPPPETPCAAPPLDDEKPESKDEVGDFVAARAGDADRVRAARKRLVEWGLTEDKAKQFPAQQVILLDEKHEYERVCDEGLKLMSLPYWQAEKFLAAVPKEKGRLFDFQTNCLTLRQAAARLDQRIALLRCVEALRMVAAENDGKLPAKLADVNVPMPLDPITGQPFAYQLDGDTATLHGTAPRGREKAAAFNVRYEVTIVK